MGWVRNVAVGWLEWLRAADERWEMAREDLMSGFAWEEEKEFLGGSGGVGAGRDGWAAGEGGCEGGCEKAAGGGDGGGRAK